MSDEVKAKRCEICVVREEETIMLRLALHELSAGMLMIIKALEDGETPPANELVVWRRSLEYVQEKSLGQMMPS